MCLCDCVLVVSVAWSVGSWDWGGVSRVACRVSRVVGVRVASGWPTTRDCMLMLAD